MVAFLQYLVALVIATHRVASPTAPAGSPDWLGIVFTLGAFGLVWTSVGIVYGRRVRTDSDAAFGRFLTVLDAGRISALVSFWWIAQHGMGKEWPAALGVANWVFIPHVLRLAPFVLLLSLLRAGLHPAGVRLGADPPSIGRTLRLELQQALLPLGPLLPLLVVFDLVFLAAPGSWLGAVRSVIVALPVAQALLSLAMLLGAIMVMPFLLRMLWKAHPMPPSDLRTRLDAYAARVGLRVRDILVWPTGPGVMNAFVAGAFPRFRYVFVTDGLLEALGPDEVEAVFAHEAGHARRGHVLLFFGFTTVLVLSSLLPDALGTAFANILPEAFGDSPFEFWTELDPLLRSLLMVMAWIGVVFGWISRRFEQEADVFGIDTIPFEAAAAGEALDDTPTPAQTGAAEHPFARALERIADETGGIRELTGWRHFSIADRIEFVEAYLSDADVRARYRRSIGLLRGTLLTIILGFALLAALRVPGELAAAPEIWRAARDPSSRISSQVLQSLQNALVPLPGPVRARSFLLAAQAAEQAGHADTGLRWLRSATTLSPADPYVLAAYASALAAADRPLGAEVAWRDLLALSDAPEELREQALAALPDEPAGGVAKDPEPDE